MTNKNKSVLNQIRHVARETAPQGSLVLLFGSRARGEAKKGSDWDILIVLPKQKLQQSDYDQVSYPFVELGWMLGEQINPIVYTKQEWFKSQEEMNELFADVPEALQNTADLLDKVARQGAEVARASAAATLSEVRKIIGFR